MSAAEAQGGGDDVSASRSDVQLIQEALRNETASPELLPHCEPLVRRLQEKLELAEQAIEEMQDKEEENVLRRSLLELEVQRISYALRGYLRRRLGKIERMVMHLLKDENERARMTDAEAAFAKEYFRLWGGHMRDNVLGHLPEAFRGITRQTASSEADDMVPRPDLSAYVCARAHQDVTIHVGDLETATLKAGGTAHMVPYASVKAHVESGAVFLE
ncbi:unnamed protein product [Pedinophyceae sp. YPF-701]|nr:unnamed protein product [Pedinophyceae sp. YPF-701]